MGQRYAKPLRVELLESRCMLSATVFEANDIGYFLRPAGQLERYDIPQEQWLAPIQLTGTQGTATVGWVDDDGIYVAYGSAVYRYNLDGTGQTHLLNATSTVSALHTDGNVLFVNHSTGLYARFISFSKTTNAIIDTTEQYVDSVYGSSIAPQVNKIFGRSQGVSPADITYVSYSDDGQFTGGGDSPYHGAYGGGAPTWVFPDGAKVTDTSGNVYSTDSLTRLNGFATNIADIDFVGGTIPIVLSGGTSLTAYTQTILPTGSKTLSKAAIEIFVNDHSVIAFSVNAASATGYSAEVVPLTQLSAPQPGAPIDPVGLSFTPNNVIQAINGDVLVFSKTHQSIFTWNPTLQTFGNTIPLIAVPEYMAYSSTNNTIYLAYNSGLIRKIDLNAAIPAEVAFATLPSAPLGLSTAGQYVFACDASGSWESHYTFAPNGTQISAVDWNYPSSEFIWSEANQKMYFFRDGTSPNDLLWEEINANGTIGNKMDSPLHNSAGFSHPIRVAPDGSIVVLASGVIHNATTLARQATGLANSVSDIAWLGSDIFTIRSNGGGTQVQQWSGSTYAQGLVSQLSGTPSVLKAVAGDRLLAITIGGNGVPNFQVLNASLQVIPRPVPVANAGADVAMIVGQTKTLNGSSSYDPDGSPNPLSYQWMVSGPAQATLGTPTAASTSFYADVAGTYTLYLTVSDGTYANTDKLVVSVRSNAAPIANPSLSSPTAIAGRAAATLNGSASTDPDGDTLSYSWRIVASPVGSTSSIDMPNQSVAALVASIPGTYTVELAVSDGVLSDTENFTITVNENHAPTANASLSDATGVASRKNATLRGASSSDPDGDVLTYKWTVIGSPSGSTPTITNSTASTASLAANLPGIYTVELTVSDGLAADTDQFVVTMGVNQAPNANASASQTSVVAGGIAAVLDGRLSSDPDGDTLTYAWRIVASSNGVNPAISNSTKSVAQLSASTAGAYVLELKTSDGAATDTDFVIVTVRGNQSPVADVSLSDKVITLGATARLDGSKSVDPDGDALTFQWRVVASTNGVLPQIENATSVVASLTGQTVGYYAIELSVSDAVIVDLEYLLITVANNPGLQLGDYNANGMVEPTDYDIWRRTFGSSNDLRADGNGNGIIDAADSLMLRKHQGFAVDALLAASGAAFGMPAENASIESNSVSAIESLLVLEQASGSASTASLIVQENTVGESSVASESPDLFESVWSDWPSTFAPSALHTMPQAVGTALTPNHDRLLLGLCLLDHAASKNVPASFSPALDDIREVLSITDDIFTDLFDSLDKEKLLAIGD